MKTLWEFLALLRANFFAKYLSLLTSFWLFYSFLKEGKIADMTTLGASGVVIILSCSSVVVLLDYLYKIYSQEGIHRNYEHKRISDHIRERIGTYYSQITTDPICNDNKHEYVMLHRQDLLDHNSGDYYSFRHIKGVNKSNKVSEGLIYCESTDYKIAFDQTKIEAIDVDSGEPLRVESLNNIHDKRITHSFKIYFRKPLNVNESFNIAYSIFLPNELKCLDCNEEIMSVSLVRIKKGLHELIFNLCLDFKPRAVRIYKQSSLTKKLVLIESQDTVIEGYIPTTNLEKKFSIQWNSPPFIVRWKQIEPKSKLYVIKYMR